MVILLVIWFAVGIGLILSQGPKRSAGLPLAYFLGLSMIHVPGAMLYVDDIEGGYMAALTESGFEQTVIGLVAFLAGVLIAKKTRSGCSPEGGVVQGSSWPDVDRLDRLGLYYFVFGALIYFVGMRLFGGITSAAAILSSLGSLIVVGACLRLWAALQKRNAV